MAAIARITNSSTTVKPRDPKNARQLRLKRLSINPNRPGNRTSLSRYARDSSLTHFMTVLRPPRCRPCSRSKASATLDRGLCCSRNRTLTVSTFRHRIRGRSALSTPPTGTGMRKAERPLRNLARQRPIRKFIVPTADRAPYQVCRVPAPSAQHISDDGSVSRSRVVSQRTRREEFLAIVAARRLRSLRRCRSNYRIVMSTNLASADAKKPADAGFLYLARPERLLRTSLYSALRAAATRRSASLQAMLVEPLMMTPRFSSFPAPQKTPQHRAFC